MTLSFTIPLDARTKKNSPQVFSRINKQTGKVFTKVLPSKNYLQFEKECIPFLKGLPLIDYPINLQVVFYMQTRRNVDLVGLLQSIDDILTAAGVIEDDCRDIVASHDGSRVFYDKNYPRIEIEITRAESDYSQWKDRRIKQIGLIL